jgi:diguanylate cyclase (GGDEF)-like protein
VRSTRSIEILCWVLATLILIWSKALADHPGPVAGLLGGFVLVILAFRSPWFLPHNSRARLQVESWSMLVFISAVLWFSGRSASPLLNLYLLPIALSALTLGRATTLSQVGVVAVCHLTLALATPGVEVASLVYAGRAIGELAPFLLVAYLTSTLSADITEAREHIETLAQTDSLTGLFNARMFNEVWQREHAASERSRSPYALLMIDMDKLQEINESFGHEGGDSAILLVAQCVQRSIRGTDTASRFGGDEFAVLLPGATPEVAETVVKRLRHNVNKTTLDLRSRMIRCNVSIGVVSYPKDGRDLRELSGIAERRMYRDKELRRAPAPRVPA